jgi:transposase InsO family protein
VVRDFSDVFLEELPGIPPDREVEFVVDLLPRTAPIYKRPSRISAEELKELKKQLTELYMARIMSLHGVPKNIILDRGSQFTSKFWKSFHEDMDTKLNFSSAYHRQTNGQIERTNQVLEDMLRACALQHGSSWDKSLPYVEFSYNNNYQASLKDVTVRGSV